MEVALPPAGVRWTARAAALLLVAALVLAALSARFAGPPAPRAAFAPVEALVTFGERLAPLSAAPAAHTVARTFAPAPPSAAEQGVSSTLDLAGLRCATATGRRDNRELCAEVAAAAARGRAREIALERVDGVLTRDGALQRALLRNLNSSARTYALGEAQKYIDPRDDPLFDEGTDPATAAHRPCPADVLPRGSGEALTGRTCQSYW